MATESHMLDITSCNGEIACVTLTGDFYSDEAARDAVAKLDGLFSTGILGILLDLTEARIHRSFVDQVIPLQKQAERAGKELIIQSCSPQVKTTLNGLGLLDFTTQIPLENLD